LPQPVGSRVAHIPIDNPTKRERSEPPSALLPMKDASLFLGVSAALLPRPTKTGEQWFCLGVGNPMPVVGNLNRLDAAQLVIN